MTRLVPALAVAAAAVLMVMGWSNKLPHQMLGLTTADLLGLAVRSFIPLMAFMVVVVLLWQIREGVRSIAWYLHDMVRPQQGGKVLPFRRRSG